LQSKNIRNVKLTPYTAGRAIYFLNLLIPNSHKARPVKRLARKIINEITSALGSSSALEPRAGIFALAAFTIS